MSYHVLSLKPIGTVQGNGVVFVCFVSYIPFCRKHKQRMLKGFWLTLLVIWREVLGLQDPPQHSDTS